ncbi:hypothetical protein FNV43_RR02080 [Rhamnella rubrinervis]|uniref:Uncharacterized protein n=1 Tax=Rhamnella rubrinervis TaxID=2594499 RepID=A0A8K0HR10_9ROSA|nr:hypothetical protein FNV43_RR02080 [Rhamnella rubrinervis]
MLGNTSLLLTPVSLGCESNEQLASQSDEDQLVFALDFQDYKSENAQLEELLFAEALREEQASAERRAEEKHAAHNASNMVCFHGKGSGIRTKSSRGVDNSCKNSGAIDHDASVFVGMVLAENRMELRSENFHSVKIVMCIYMKLLISCKEKMKALFHPGGFNICAVVGNSADLLKTIWKGD